MRRMPFWVRVAIGAGLGLAAAVPLWLFVGIPWLTATVGGLLAAIGFLGSFFLFSADRPEEGYEQVLFDKPNTIVTFVLLIALAGGGFSTGFLGGGVDAPRSPNEGVALLLVRSENIGATLTEAEDAEALAAEVAELRIESDRLALEIEALPEGHERTQLLSANDGIALGLDDLKACLDAERQGDACREARFQFADARAAFDRAAEPPEAEETAE